MRSGFDKLSPSWKRSIGLRSSSRAILVFGLLLPISLLAALWLGLYWRWPLAIVGLVGGALCVRGLYNGFFTYKTIRIRSALWALHLAMCASALAFAVPGDDAVARLNSVLGMSAQEVKNYLVATLLLIYFFVLAVVLIFLVGQVKHLLSDSVWRQALRFNRHAWVKVFCAVCGGALWVTALTMIDESDAQSNLQAVISLGNAVGSGSGTMVFTPGRFAFEVMATTYALPPGQPFSLMNRLRSFYTDPDAVVRFHANAQDPFSNAQAITDKQRHHQRIGQQERTGIVAHLPDRTLPDTSGLPLGHVREASRGSAAASAGVARGDLLVAINGMPLAQWMKEDAAQVKAAAAQKYPALSSVNAAPKPVVDDKTKGLLVRKRNGSEVLLKKQTFKNNGFEAVALFTLAGPSSPGLARPHQAGQRADVLYLRVSKFTETVAKTVANKIIDASLDGSTWLLDVNTLVIDLRGNPGGWVGAPVQLAQLLATPFLLTPQGGDTGIRLAHQETAANGQTQTQLVDWGDTGQIKTLQADVGLARPLPKGALPKAEPLVNALLPGLKTVVFLADSDSCSASELLMYGLGLYAQSQPGSGLRTAHIGSATCGKPYGSQSYFYGGFELHTLSTIVVQPGTTATSAYPKGLTPTCAVADAMLGPETGAEDVLFHTGLYWAATGRCGLPNGAG